MSKELKRPWKKLSEKDILKMKELYKTNTRLKVSKIFNVTPSTVSYHCGLKRLEKQTIEEKKKLNIKRVSDRRRKNKQLAIDYKGGKCELCGYNKYNGALDFHHLNKETKEYSIAATGSTRSFENTKKELDKCILVCSNCHREIHGGLHNLNK